MSPRLDTIGATLVAILIATTGPFCFALAPDKARTETTLEAGYIQSSVDTLAGKVESEYFDSAVGAMVASKIREAQSRGQYGKAQNLEALANLLTSEMYAVAKDRHLSLGLVRPQSPQPSMGSAIADETREERGRRENFGFQKIEILPGNVGYLRVTAFYRPEETRQVIAEAMAFLCHVKALIVDLRDHGGGATPTVALFTSYFLDSQDMPLFAIYPRPPAVPRQYLTEPGTLTHRDSIRPTFLLTSAGTCSGGEGVAFLLQERHRAVVVGEGTWGGANQVPNPRPITQDLQAFIPNGRMSSGLTGKSWEGTGVIPDISVNAGRALRVAHAMAIEALLRSAPEGLWRENLKKELALAESESSPETNKR